MKRKEAEILGRMEPYILIGFGKKGRALKKVIFQGGGGGWRGRLSSYFIKFYYTHPGTDSRQETPGEYPSKKGDRRI